jgi:hypothetical protein
MTENPDLVSLGNSLSTPEQLPTLLGRRSRMDNGNGWLKWARDSHQLEKTCTDGGSGSAVAALDAIRTRWRAHFQMYTPKMQENLVGSHKSAKTMTTDVQDGASAVRHHHPESTTPHWPGVTSRHGNRCCADVVLCHSVFSDESFISLHRVAPVSRNMREPQPWPLIYYWETSGMKFAERINFLF